MTKTNHRLHATARRSHAAYDDAQKRELAFYDARRHMATSRNVGFGKREPTGAKACAASCGHPACSHGCTLVGRFDLSGGSR